MCCEESGEVLLSRHILYWHRLCIYIHSKCTAKQNDIHVEPMVQHSWQDRHDRAKDRVIEVFIYYKNSHTYHKIKGKTESEDHYLDLLANITNIAH